MHVRVAQVEALRRELHLAGVVRAEGAGALERDAPAAAEVAAGPGETHLDRSVTLYPLYFRDARASASASAREPFDTSRFFMIFL